MPDGSKEHTSPDGRYHNQPTSPLTSAVGPWPQPPVKLKCEQYIGQLALPVRLPLVVCLLRLQVIKVDVPKVVGCRGDVDDAAGTVRLAASAGQQTADAGLQDT